MKRIACVVAGSVLAAMSQAVVIIDDYTTGSFNLTSATTAYSTQTGSMPNIVQGFRMSVARINANPNSRDLTMEIDPGALGKLFVEAGSGVDAFATFQYFNSYTGAASGSGLPNGANYVAFAPTVDLSGESKFRVHYENADQDTDILIAVLDPSLGNFRTLTQTATAGTGFVDFDFSSFTAGAVSFSNIGLIELTADLPNGNDITFTRFEAVPEPATLLVLAAGAGLLVRRRRR